LQKEIGIQDMFFRGGDMGTEKGTWSLLDKENN
jgi:hypothetical protein